MAAARHPRAPSEILDVLENDFYRDARVIYEKTFDLTHKLPAQPNNEFRNALNHLGRACIATDDEDFDHQIKMARWHFLTAKRDCYKIGLTYLKYHLNTDLILYEDEKGYARSLRRRLRKVEVTYYDILAAEIRNDPEIDARFEKLWADAVDLMTDIYQLVVNLHELRRRRLPPYQ